MNSSRAPLPTLGVMKHDSLQWFDSRSVMASSATIDATVARSLTLISMGRRPSRMVFCDDNDTFGYRDDRLTVAISKECPPCFEFNLCDLFNSAAISTW